MKSRATGWLTEQFHQSFREIALHAGVRERLLCPLYTLMPDHVHLIWLGISAASDQRPAAAFLRRHLERQFANVRFQHQPHDSVLRDEDRKRGAFSATCYYVAENPVRAGLVTRAEEWLFTGSLVPGYPDLNPFAANFWTKYWKIYAFAVARGELGKTE